MNYEFCAASVMGRHHATAGKNNQDAFAVEVVDGGRAIIAVVCDGCGSGKHSELAARILADAAVGEMFCWRDCIGTSEGENIADGLTEMMASCLSNVMIATESRHKSNYKQHVFDNYLATCIAAVMTETHTLVLKCGDGVVQSTFAQEAEPTRDDNNSPQYLGYRLIRPWKKPASEMPRFKVIVDAPHFRLSDRYLMIGTDGAGDYINISMNHSELPTIGELFTNDAYYKNPDLLRRKLFKASRDKPDFTQGRIVPGLLHDDTTMVVIRAQK